MNGRAGSEPKLLFPGLTGFYAAVSDLWYPMIRITAGGILLVHGWGKIKIGPTAGFLKAYVDLGFDPPLPWFWSALAIEFAGGIALILGLFTRFFAAAAAIELLIITWVYWKTGFSWLNRGYEYTLLWGWLCFAIALRGGGPYSLDRWLGKEL